MKKIISALLAICFVFSSGFTAVASNLNEIYESVENAKDKPDNFGDSTIPDVNEQLPTGIPTFLKPTEYLYGLFKTIMDLYIENHLYDFTEEELWNQFLYDLIETHPEMYEMFLKTMLSTMDQYSSYYEKDSGYLSLESDSSGYGITVKEADYGILIEKVVSGSEAEKAGILPGDVLVGVFGYDTTNLPWNLVARLLKYPYVYVSEPDENGKFTDFNPEILLTVERGEQRLDFKLKKGPITTEELSTSYLEMDDRQVAYISISSFIADDLAEKFKKEIENFKNDGYTKLTIDLRNNGGGSLKLAVEMAEIFVEKGETLCYYNDKNATAPMPIVSDNEKIEFDSISVLVNEHTASAAELMASILRNKAGAVLVGNKTFGKAIGQTVYALNSGANVSITTYEILDANMENYNDIGLVPELVLDNVTMLYVLPELGVFNHVNYKEIQYGVYSEPCLALEKRLSVLGFLKESVADGIWDGSTTLAVYFLQKTFMNDNITGGLNDRTVTLITDLIDGCKDDKYLEDSQLDCALIYHGSLDQAKRLIKEKITLAKKQDKLIEENEKRLEEEAEL